MRRRLLLCILVMASTVGVISHERAGAISNGIAVNPVPPWAALVTQTGKFGGFLQTKEGSCTGTIVGQGWVLTAAHCVFAEVNGIFTKVQPPGVFRVVLGRSDLQRFWQGGQWTVDAVAVYDNWKSGDFALLHLKGPLLSSSLPLALAPRGYQLSDNEYVDSFGYGNTTETYPTHDPKQYTLAPAQYLEQSASNSYEYKASCSATLFLCMQFTGPSLVLHGDSGGPWVEDPSNPYIVGVTHGGDGNFDWLTRTTGFYPDETAGNVANSNVHDWIVKTAGIFVGAPKTIYRDGAGHSWLFESDGFLHPIPTGGDFLCFKGQGDQLVDLDQFTLAELPTNGTPATCSPGGDVYVSIGNGQVERFSSSGTLLSTLSTGLGSYTTGLGFGPDGDLYVTDFGAQAVSKFDPSGNLLATWSSAFSSSDPESVTFDTHGHVFVGQADGSGQVLEFDQTGNLLNSFSPLAEDRGTDWIALGPDNCTLYYTSEGTTVKRFDICTNTQLADFATGLPGTSAFEIALLPSGGMLVADTGSIVRLDASGDVIQQYSTGSSDYWFSLALANDGTSFWAGDLNTGHVAHFSLATGQVEGEFYTTNSQSLDAAGGIAISPTTCSSACTVGAQ